MPVEENYQNRWCVCRKKTFCTEVVCVNNNNNMMCEYHVKAGIHAGAIMTQSQSPQGAASSYTI